MLGIGKLNGPKKKVPEKKRIGGRVGTALAVGTALLAGNGAKEARACPVLPNSFEITIPGLGKQTLKKGIENKFKNGTTVKVIDNGNIAVTVDGKSTRYRIHGDTRSLGCGGNFNARLDQK